MRKEDSDAQYDKKRCNSFKHRRILCNRSLSDRPRCTVKEISLSELNFPPGDDFKQHVGCLQQAEWEEVDDEDQPLVRVKHRQRD
jgi:hypothetical protein